MKRNHLAIVSAVIICTILLVLALPRNNKSFNYTYHPGEPWRYEQLIAPYEFPISKSDEQLRQDRDSALRDFSPYYYMAPAVANQQIANFRADYAKGAFPNVPYAYMSHAVEVLGHYYEHGIVEPRNYSRLVANRQPGLRIVDGTTAKYQALEDIYTTRVAYQHIMEADAAKYHRDVMARLHLNDYLEANLVYDSARTEAARQEILAGISSAYGMVQGGERIIDHGELITQHKYNVLESLRKRQEETTRLTRTSTTLVAIGQGGLIALLFCLMLVYLQLFRKDRFRDVHTIYLIFGNVTLFCIVSFLFVKYQFFSVYMIPFAMVPIFIRIFMDTRTSYMAHIVMVLICAIPLRTNYQFVLTEMTAGLVAIYSLRDLTERAQLFRTAAYVTLAAWSVGIFYDLAQGLSLDHIDKSWYYYIGFNGIALLFAYPLLYLIERLFGFTSSVTLIELSNINTPILKRMSKVAQGTFQHSMQVANLAGEVAAQIGAKVQLVRTGALYHDIGKMEAAAFFTENQSGVNPHDSLSEERSAQIIIGHVLNGRDIAEKHHLPKDIRDFIITHHGQSLVKYFYIQSCNKLGEENVDKAAFTYPGINPFTREQAILMMADSVEAASRSLKEYTEESIARLVNAIIDGQMAAGCFRECPITFRDIADAKRVFIDSLKTIYHTRIAYPELKKDAAAQPAAEPTQRQPKGRLFGSNNWTWRKS